MAGSVGGVGEGLSGVGIRGHLHDGQARRIGVGGGVGGFGFVRFDCRQAMLAVVVNEQDDPSAVDELAPQVDVRREGEGLAEPLGGFECNHCAGGPEGLSGDIAVDCADVDEVRPGELDDDAGAQGGGEDCGGG